MLLTIVLRCVAVLRIVLVVLSIPLGWASTHQFEMYGYDEYTDYLENQWQKHLLASVLEGVIWLLVLRAAPAIASVLLPPARDAGRRLGPWLGVGAAVCAVAMLLPSMLQMLMPLVLPFEEPSSGYYEGLGQDPGVLGNVLVFGLAVLFLAVPRVGARLAPGRPTPEKDA